MNYIASNGLFIVVLGFLAGVAYGILYEFSPPTFTALLLLFSGCVLNKRFLFAVGIFFCSLGIWRADLWQQEVLNHPLPQEAILSGFISAEPDVREFNTRYTVTLDSGVKVLASVLRYPEYEYGDYVSIANNCEVPKDFTTDTDRIFQYKKFLEKDGILFVCSRAQLTVVSQQTHGNVIIRTLFKLKKLFIGKMNQILPEPHTSLLGGLLLGAKSSLGGEILEQFRVTGVIHIVVLSGFNVTIVAEAVMRTLSFLGVRISAVLGSLSIIAFMFLTGAGATVVRASLMALFVIAARVLGREGTVLRLLVLAAGVMVWFSPYILLYDPSFQLSFLATLGLIVIVPLIDPYIQWVPKTMFDIRGLTSASLATQIIVLPFLIWMSGEVSVISLVVNILILWAIPLTMLVGFLSVLVSYVSITFAIPISMLAYILLGYILWIVQKGAELPVTTVLLGPLSVYSMILLYIFGGIIWYAIHRSKPLEVERS